MANPSDAKKPAFRRAFDFLASVRRGQARKQTPSAANNTAPATNATPTPSQLTQRQVGPSTPATAPAPRPALAALDEAPLTASENSSSTSAPSSPAKSAPQVNSCPFMHGTVYADPFPNYVHGSNPQICANGCTPQLSSALTRLETPTETLLREAIEYQHLFHHEMGSAETTKVARIHEITSEISTTGTYTHTFQELQHGARLAWRNSPKCSNRKFWDSINLLDARSVTTNREMLDACLHHLYIATSAMVAEANITVFRPPHPTAPNGVGPRVWNTQLVRYAGHRMPDGSIRGDPSEVGFTDMVKDKFGWLPPGGEPGNFDLLPLVLQIDPDQPPEIFDVPQRFAMQVPLLHPKHAWFAELNLRWYAVPAVSNMGILYTAIPFNGWYADTEIVRNLSDECRYNKLPRIAEYLGLDASSDRTLWKDTALVALNEAVMHSFQQANVAMVDHHTLMAQFYEWYYEEKKRRGYVSGNWKWIIPPVASSMNPCYEELRDMIEYSCKPIYRYAPGWRKYPEHGTGRDESSA